MNRPALTFAEHRQQTAQAPLSSLYPPALHLLAQQLEQASPNPTLQASTEHTLARHLHALHASAHTRPVFTRPNLDAFRAALPDLHDLHSRVFGELVGAQFRLFEHLTLGR